MKRHILLTAVGPDRVGIVDDLSKAVLDRGCNIEESRMALLGGDFAALLLASGTESAVGALMAGCADLGAALKLSVTARLTAAPVPSEGAVPYILETASVDAPGIVQSVASVLRKAGVNIADLETDTAPAPWTGAPMFTMKARLSVPSSVPVHTLREALAALEAEHNLDLSLVSAAKGLSEL